MSLGSHAQISSFVIVFFETWRRNFEQYVKMTTFHSKSSGLLLSSLKQNKKTLLRI